MKIKNIISALGLFLLLSCNNDLIDTAIEHNVCAEDSQIEFAKILSKAVANNEDVRAFIKSEALKQFDKDYDVFYPYVKDKLLPSGLSFREELLKYTTEDNLASIEASLPLLNILVPDWEWIGAFSVNTWDLSDNDIVVCSSVEGESEHVLYYDGEHCCTLRKGSFPEYPVLIVKENERMKILTAKTRSSDYTYSFASEAYNPNSMETKVTPVTSTIYFELNPGSNSVEATSFELAYPDVVQAWNEYGDDVYGAQRNLLYFGLNQGETLGILNPKIRESIYAIRLNDKLCMDDPKQSDTDESHDAIIGNKTLYDNDVLNNDELLNTLWSDGQLEIQLYATTKDENGNVYLLNDNKITVDGRDLFDISQVRRDFYHKVWLHRRRFEYTVDLQNLKPKWYILPTPLKFRKWDPSIMSTVIDIRAYEYDKSTEIEITDTLISQCGISISAKSGDYIDLTFDLNADKHVQTMKYMVCQGSDDLGSIEFQYDDFVIKREVGDEYELNVYSTNKLDFIMIPTVY